MDMSGVSRHLGARISSIVSLKDIKNLRVFVQLKIMLKVISIFFYLTSTRSSLSWIRPASCSRAITSGYWLW